MTKQQINRIYIRTRLRYIMQDCFITDELVGEVMKMLKEVYLEGLEKGKNEAKQQELTYKHKNVIL